MITTLAPQGISEISRLPQGNWSPFAVGQPIAILDAAQGITLNGSNAAGWADQSGNGNDVLQGTAADQPGWNATDGNLNGQPSVVADGVSEYLESALFADGDISQPNTIFGVMKYKSLGGGTPILIDGRDSTARHAMFHGATNFSLFAGTSVVAVQTRDTNSHVWAALFNQASTQSWLDGGTPASPATPGAQAMGGITLFASDTATAWGNAKLAYVLIYNADLSDAAKNYIGNGLAVRFGTTWTDI